MTAIAEREWRWGETNFAQLAGGRIHWKIEWYESWQSYDKFAAEGVPGILILYFGRAAVPNDILAAVAAHLGVAAPVVEDATVLRARVAKFITTRQRRRTQTPCADCAAKHTLDERLQLTAPFVIATHDPADVGRVSRREVDHLRRCARCGQLYSYTYEYTYLVTGSEEDVDLVAVDHDRAVTLLVESLWRDKRAAVWNIKTGRQMG